MRYQLMAIYRGLAFEACVGPTDEDVALFASSPPPSGLQFEYVAGHWRRQVSRGELDALWESRATGRYRGHGCLVLDDLGDRLHIAFRGHDAYQAEQLGYWQVDRGVYEVVVPRHDVTDLTEVRTDHPLRRAEPAPPTGPPGPAPVPPAPVPPAPAPAPAGPMTAPVGPLPPEVPASAAAGLAPAQAPGTVIGPPESLAAGEPSGAGPLPPAPGPVALPEPATAAAVPPPAPPGPLPGPPGWVPAEALGAMATQPQRPMAARHGAPVPEETAHAAPAHAAPAHAVPPHAAPAPAEAAPAEPAHAETTLPAPPVHADAGPVDAGPLGAGPADAGSLGAGPADAASRGSQRQQPAPGPAGAGDLTVPVPAEPPRGMTSSLAADMMAPAPPRDPAPNGTSRLSAFAPGPGQPGTRETSHSPDGPNGTPGTNGWNGWNGAGHTGPADQSGTAAHAEGTDGTGAQASSDAARPRRPDTRSVFRDLVELAAVPEGAYALDEDVDGALCLVRTDDGYEVYSSAGNAKHEVRFFDDEESAYFYLFGVLTADALRSGRLIRYPG